MNIVQTEGLTKVYGKGETAVTALDHLMILLGLPSLLALAGTAFGILAGLWLGYVMVGGMNAGGFVMPYYFPYAGILVAIAVGLLLGVVAAVLPARQAAKLDIVTALHYE